MYLILKANNRLVKLGNVYPVNRTLPAYRGSEKLVVSEIVHPNDKYPLGLIISKTEELGKMPSRMEFQPLVIDAIFVDETYKRVCPGCNSMVLFETQDMCSTCEADLKSEAGI